MPAGLDARVAGRAVDLLGPPAPRLLRDDPWRLLAIVGVAPADADRVARLALPGVTRDDARRSRALVGWVLARHARDGHTVSPGRWSPATLASGIGDEQVGDRRGARVGHRRRGRPRIDGGVGAPSSFREPSGLS